MVKLVNRAKMSTPTTSTGPLSLGSAIDGYRSFTSAGIVDGDEVRYVIEDGNDWEIGTGLYSGQVGLTGSLFNVSGSSGSWIQRTVDLSSYSGATVRIVFKHTVASTGTSYLADLQIDEVNIDNNSYNFESSTHGFQTTFNGSYGDYSDAIFTDLSTGTSGERWNRDAAGTPSGSTGLTTGANGTSWYVYTESSNPAVNGDIFWLRSPQITLSQSAGNLTFYEARLGSTIGDLDVYVDVINGGNIVLSRNVTESSNSNNALDLSGSAVVFVSATAEDLSSGGLAQTVASTSSTSQTELAVYPVADYGSAKLIVTAKRGTDRQMSELLVIHDGTTAVATEYGQIYTGNPLATFDVDISGGNFRLLATATSATTTNYTIKEIAVDA